MPKDRLIIIVLGPTAKLLAYDLNKLGYRALDLGHMAKAYEWLKTRDNIVAGQFLRHRAGFRQMKILVHLHLFYQDMLPEMLTLLRSLDGYEYDLFATVVNASPETLAELRRFKPEVTVIDVENRGYDVAPFVKVLQLADLSSYDYVIKLHTKQNLKRRAWLKNVSFTGSGWRRLLVSFMASSEQLRRTLALFAILKPEWFLITI